MDEVERDEKRWNQIEHIVFDYISLNKADVQRAVRRMLERGNFTLNDDLQFVPVKRPASLR